MTDVPTTPEERAVALLRYLSDTVNYPCRLDHHGHCQDHPGGFRVVPDPTYRSGEWDGERPECWMAAARAVIQEVDAR